MSAVESSAAKHARTPQTQGCPGMVQDGWYARNRGHPIVARFADGKTVSGVLEAWDTYTLTLNVAGHAEPVLIYKHALAFVARKAE